MSFSRAHQLLREAKVTGLESRQALRLAFHAGKLPGFKKKKGSGSKAGLSHSRIYFEPGPIYDLIGKQLAERDRSTVDQALVKYYEESPEHDPITALSDGVAQTLHKAQQVFLDWHACKRNPFVLAAEAARKKKARDESPAPVDAGCPQCGRRADAARTRDAEVARLVTGDHERSALDLDEERRLSEFSGFRCIGCWSWLDSAPVIAMRETWLRMLPISRERSTPDASVSATSGAQGGGRTPDGVEAVADDGRTTEEVPPPPDISGDP